MRHIALAALLVLVPLPGHAFPIRAQFHGNQAQFHGNQGTVPHLPAGPRPQTLQVWPIHRPWPPVFFGGGPFLSVPPVLGEPFPVYDAPMYPAPTYMVAPTPPPMRRVIDYPEGRYELQGDGVTSPYVWVWVPNPPSAPPSPPPPPVAPPAPQEPPLTQTGPRTPNVIYQWVDDQGVVHWTDDRQRVPERFRSKATRFEDGRPSS